MLTSVAAILQTDDDVYNEGMGQTIGYIIGALLLIGIVAWLIKRSRKG